MNIPRRIRKELVKYTHFLTLSKFAGICDFGDNNCLFINKFINFKYMIKK